MKKLLILMATLELSIAAAQTTTAPFGIPMGTTVAQLKKMGAVPSTDSQIYVLTDPPIKNANFERYLIRAGQKSGVCKIVAIGKPINTSSDGSGLRSAFVSMNNVLNTKYGSATEKFDFLKSGSIWDEPKDFMMGLVVDERYYNNYWVADKGARLGNNISIMALEGNARTSTQGYITVGYEYKNLDSCTKEKASTDGNGL